MHQRLSWLLLGASPVRQKLTQHNTFQVSFLNVFCSPADLCPSMPLMTAHCTALPRLLALHACPTGQHCCLSAATCCGVYTYLCGHYLVTPFTTVLTSQVKVWDQTMWTASLFSVWKRAGVNQIQQSSCKQMRSKGSDKVMAQTPQHHTESVVLQFQA